MTTIASAEQLSLLDMSNTTVEVKDEAAKLLAPEEKLDPSTGLPTLATPKRKRNTLSLVR